MKFQDICRTFSRTTFGCRCSRHANAAHARQLLKLTRTILIQNSVVRVRNQSIDRTHQLNNHNQASAHKWLPFIGQGCHCWDHKLILFIYFPGHFSRTVVIFQDTFEFQNISRTRVILQDSPGRVGTLTFRGVVAQWKVWCLASKLHPQGRRFEPHSCRHVRTLAKSFTSITWSVGLRGCIAVKFDSCNNPLSSLALRFGTNSFLIRDPLY